MSQTVNSELSDTAASMLTLMNESPHLCVYPHIYIYRDLVCTRIYIYIYDIHSFFQVLAIIVVVTTNPILSSFPGPPRDDLAREACSRSALLGDLYLEAHRTYLETST